MAERRLKIWYDREGDFLEVVFEDRAGYFRETDNDRVMEKIDDQGLVIGFSILKVMVRPFGGWSFAFHE